MDLIEVSRMDTWFTFIDKQIMVVNSATAEITSLSSFVTIPIIVNLVIVKFQHYMLLYDLFAIITAITIVDQFPVAASVSPQVIFTL